MYDMEKEIQYTGTSILSNTLLMPAEGVFCLQQMLCYCHLLRSLFSGGREIICLQLVTGQNIACDLLLVLLGYANCP